MSNDSREILVVLSGGKRRKVTNIPANAKITFGPVSPGKSGYESRNALRIYTSTSNQLAVFVGVEEFRDTSLEVQEQRVSSKRKENRKVDSSGSSTEIAAEESYEWESVE